MTDGTDAFWQDLKARVREHVALAGAERRMAEAETEPLLTVRIERMVAAATGHAGNSVLDLAERRRGGLRLRNWWLPVLGIAAWAGWLIFDVAPVEPERRYWDLPAALDIALDPQTEPPRRRSAIERTFAFVEAGVDALSGIEVSGGPLADLASRGLDRWRARLAVGDDGRHLSVRPVYPVLEQLRGEDLDLGSQRVALSIVIDDIEDAIVALQRTRPVDEGVELLRRGFLAESSQLLNR